MLLMFLIFLLPMTMVTMSIFNIGVAASEKIKVQDAADNAAYSAATWEARYMNLTAYINRAMVANYDAIATLVGVWSSIDAIDGFVDFAKDVLDVFFGVGEVLEPVHDVMHIANEVISNVVGGNLDTNPRLASVIEEYTNLLSEAQDLIYYADQLGRPTLIQKIAGGVDANIQYWLPSEAWNFQKLSARRVYQAAEDTMSSNPDDGLRLTIEHSLNALSNGGSIRDTENFLPAGLGSILNSIPILHINIGWEGFDGPEFDHKTGESLPDGANPLSNAINPSATRTKIVNDDQLYQLDHAGIDFRIRLYLIPDIHFQLGHSSDDAWNLPLYPSVNVPHLTDDIGPHDEEFIEPNTGCSVATGSMGSATPPTQAEKDQLKQLGDLASLCQKSDPSRTFTTTGGKFVDTNGDPSNPSLTSCVGATGQAATDCTNNTNTATFPTTFIPTQYVNTSTSGYSYESCQQVSSDLEDKSPSTTPDASNVTGGNCATVYNWHYALKTMKVTTYVQESGVKDGLRVEGPSVFVYVKEPSDKIPHFQGLHLYCNRDLEAYAFARVYYTQRVGDRDGVTDDGKLFNDPQHSNKETLFNPFWAARLERPDTALLLH